MFDRSTLQLFIKVITQHILHFQTVNSIILCKTNIIFKTTQYNLLNNIFYLISDYNLTNKTFFNIINNAGHDILVVNITISQKPMIIIQLCTEKVLLMFSCNQVQLKIQE